VTCDGIGATNGRPDEHQRTTGQKITSAYLASGPGFLIHALFSASRGSAAIGLRNYSAALAARSISAATSLGCERKIE